MYDFIDLITFCESGSEINSRIAGFRGFSRVAISTALIQNIVTSDFEKIINPDILLINRIREARRGHSQHARARTEFYWSGPGLLLVCADFLFV